MAFSPAALSKLFRRDQVKDPFSDGGDDLFDDGESRFAGKGPKIAIAVSGAMLLGIAGLIGAAFLMGGTETAPPVAGSLADLEIVDEPQAGAPTGTAAADPTAATDRSTERRPWLSAPSAPAAAPRLGMDTKTAAVTPPATTAAVTPPPTPTPAPPAARPAPAAPAQTSLPAPAAPTPKPATAAAPAATPPGATPPSPAAAVAAASASATPPTPPPVQEEEAPPREIAGIPALVAPGAAPGAPGRFDATGDAGPAVAGGRPRLVDPPLPPTDRIAVSAPPPRFAALRDARKDTPAPAAGAAKLAIIVRGLGLSQSATEAAITKLPPAVTLAFSPYARDLKRWVERAKAQGHEVLIEVPMESKQFPAEDPGPLGLLTTLELKDNNERLDTILKASAGAIGVLDSMGTKFRESNPHITPVFGKLKEQDLFYVQGTPGVRVGEATVPTAVADVVIDERPFRAAIDARLDYAERLAKYQGSAVAALNAKPVGFERLVLWLEQAQRNGVALAPISQVLIR